MSEYLCVFVCFRLYLQLCVSDLIIISPSAAMSISLMEKKRDQTDRREADQKRDRHDDDDDDGLRSACVSLIFRLNSKQGVMLRNTSASADSHTLQMGFTARVVCLGDVQIWKNDPKNRRIQTRETDGRSTMVRCLHCVLIWMFHYSTLGLFCWCVCVLQIDLHFVDVCVRWFPVLHPGSVYRLIALNTEVTHTHTHTQIRDQSQ